MGGSAVLSSMGQQSLPATVFRGGTSKGIFFERSKMPADRNAWDGLLLETFGSPDPMQIDGIGGSHSVTSKAMIVWASEADDVDIEYRFGQVSVDTPVVDWGGNCGNLTFAIGPFALERGLVTEGLESNRTELVLRNVNTDTVIEQTIPLDGDRRPDYQGDFEVAGVPGTGGRITSRFIKPQGSETGSLFPTGNRIDRLDVAGRGQIDASLVDVASPCVFVRAEDVGMTAAETPAEIDADAELLDHLESIRSAACERYGFVDDAASATDESPGIPKLAVVGEKRGYTTSAGRHIGRQQYDILARIMSMQKAHHTYAITGAMCTAVAAVFPGTIPEEVVEATGLANMTIGHPKGTLTVGVGVDDETVTYTEVDRTARQIMVGELYYAGVDTGAADVLTSTGDRSSRAVR